MSVINRTLFVLSALFTLFALAPVANFARNLSSVDYIETKLSPSGLTEGNSFGQAVAVCGNTAVVTSKYGPLLNQAAYVFTRSGSTWTQQAKLTPSDGVPGMLFGTSVAIDKDT